MNICNIFLSLLVKVRRFPVIDDGRAGTWLLQRVCGIAYCIIHMLHWCQGPGGREQTNKTPILHPVLTGQPSGTYHYGQKQKSQK